MDVDIRDLRKRYGALAALDGVTLSVPAGGRVALAGPNGAGKSTLLRAIMGMVECEGLVRVGGLSPFTDRVRLAERLAYVPQQAPRLAAPVAEVVAAVARLRGIREDAIACVAGRLGLDLAACARKPFRDLSGGMKQKLLLALAFAAEASLYILDEPTASLDGAAREHFFDLVATLPGAPTLIVCSHRPEELRRLADRVVALEEGRVSYDGPAERFLAPAARTTTIAREMEDLEARNILRPDPATAARFTGGRWVAAVLIAGLVALAAPGCTRAPEGPVEPVWDKTPCARCAMLVGERAFAAQLQTESGEVRDYDDPGCLFADEVERPSEARARWFRHVREDRWVAGERVAFVTATPTPMDFGLGAVEAGTPGAVPLAAARERCLARAGVVMRPPGGEGAGPSREEAGRAAPR